MADPERGSNRRFTLWTIAVVGATAASLAACSSSAESNASTASPSHAVRSVGQQSCKAIYFDPADWTAGSIPDFDITDELTRALYASAREIEQHGYYGIAQCNPGATPEEVGAGLIPASTDRFGGNCVVEGVAGQGLPSPTAVGYELALACYYPKSELPGAGDPAAQA